MKRIFLRNLEDGPALLKDLIAKIPADMCKIRRIPSKWSIHEHTCHLADVQPMLLERLERFKAEAHPTFTPYFPGANVPDDHLIDMDLERSLIEFRKFRDMQIQLLENYSDADWVKKASHPEYMDYGAEILVRHILMHDHLHMYRIEELWLTVDKFLPKG